MPSTSEKQKRYIYYLRGKYKNKTNTPEKQKWIWEPSWEKVKENMIQKIIVPETIQIGNLVLEAGDAVFIEDKQMLKGDISYSEVQPQDDQKGSYEAIGTIGNEIKNSKMDLYKR